VTRLIGGIALVFLVGGSGSRAYADGSWCAFYDPSTYNCGFYSYDQCYATAFANGASCRPNFFQGYELVCNPDCIAVKPGEARPTGKKARDKRQ
jgi:hypothetical protein